MKLKKAELNNATSQAAQFIELPIAQIVIEPSVNVRHDALDSDTIHVYRDTPNLPPVEVMVIDGKPYLGGGEHRIQAAIERGDKTIKAVVVRGSTLDELRDHSDFSNLQHGLPLTRHQRREVACRLHMRHPEWSNRELAKRMGTSHPTISAYLKDDSQTTGKNLPPTKSNSVNVSPLAETAPAVQPTPLKETGVAQVGVPAKHRNTPAPSPVDPAPAVVDAEITSFAESAYIQLCELDAKRAGQPIAQITRKKLHGLLDLISEILGTKEVGQ